MLFSHPAVEAITWWDFSDLGSWQGAPAGLVRSDMTPKPFYDWLMAAFHKQWTTDAQATADTKGRATVKAFFGDYAVQATTASGQKLKGTFHLARSGEHSLDVVMA